MSETTMAAAFGGGKGSGDDNPDDWNKKGKAAAMKVSDSSSTSIGEPSEDDDDEQEDQAEIQKTSLDCMDALEAALPMKRGLSTSYTGKSKSFSNLSELNIENVKDIGKKEPLPNKRRRLLISYHDKYPIFSRSFSTPLMIPTVDHDDDKKDEDEESKKVGYEAGDEKEEG